MPAKINERRFKMKKVFGFLLCLSMLFLFCGFVSADEDGNMTVKVNVLESEIGISVPNEIIIGDIAKGYISERKDLVIENTGTTDIDITLDLEESYTGTIFQNLVFQRVLADDPVRLRYFDFEIEKPDEVGDTESETIYMYLDLQDYEGDIDDDMMDHSTTVIFTAMPI